jgi:hypothetical protein
LRATNQVFELTDEQERHLRTQGVSQNVLREMRDINRELREQLMQDQSVIGRDPAQR